MLTVVLCGAVVVGEEVVEADSSLPEVRPGRRRASSSVSGAMLMDV